MSHPATRLLLGFAAFLLVGWAVGELWLSIVGSADLEVVREIAAQRTAALTEIAKVVTWAGSAFLLVPLALICCVALIRAGLRREALAVALSLGGAMLLSDLIKLLVSRPRPPVEHLQGVTGSSFPSGHATQASAFWFSLVLVLRATGGSRTAIRVAAAVALVLVVTVAASRVYLGVHYPSDVMAGILLGIGWAVFVARCLLERRVQ
ncbi:MAG: phosphatase PAP2 family protein [Solirubrobacteraceae bacterium]